MSIEEKTKEALSFSDEKLYLQLAKSNVSVQGRVRYGSHPLEFKWGQAIYHKDGKRRDGKYLFDEFLKYNLNRICKIWNETIKDEIDDVERIAIVLASVLIKSGLPIEAAVTIAVLLIRRGLNKLCQKD